jgi:XisI protein
MDTMTRYREIMQRLIEEYARYKPSHGEIDTETVIDPIRNH